MQSIIHSKKHLGSKNVGRLGVGASVGYFPAPVVQNRAQKTQKSLSCRNFYLDVAPHLLKVVLENSSKSQLVAHGRQIKALLLPVPSLVSSNQRRALFILLRYCKRLYYAS